MGATLKMFVVVLVAVIVANLVANHIPALKG